jgi:hypothetical protein
LDFLLTEASARKTKQLEWFLQDACVRLGFCLSQQVRDKLTAQRGLSASDFVCAIIEAEGLDMGHAQNSEHFPSLMDLYQKHVEEI